MIPTYDDLSVLNQLTDINYDSETDSDEKLLITGVWSTFSMASFVAFGNEGDYKTVLKDHRLESTELPDPADKRMKLIVDNRDETIEEFESMALRIEKLIPGNTNATLWIGPLKAGRHTFVGEFHEDTAQGVLISK